MTTTWFDRPVEEAGLFNPAFGCLLVAKAVGDYRKQTGQGLPFPLGFLILPAVLHAATRSALPGRTTAVMQNWIAENGALLADFPERVRHVAHLTKEAILFGLQHHKLGLDDGRLLPGSRPYRANAALGNTTAETEDCIRSAAFLGRWLATAGTSATILSSWGVRP